MNKIDNNINCTCTIMYNYIELEINYSLNKKKSSQANCRDIEIDTHLSKLHIHPLFLTLTNIAPIYCNIVFDYTTDNNEYLGST